MYAIENKYIFTDDDYHAIVIPAGVKEINKLEKYCGDILIDTETDIMYFETDLFKSKIQALGALKRRRKEFLEQNNWEEAIPYIEEIINANRKRNQDSCVR